VGNDARGDVKRDAGQNPKNVFINCYNSYCSVRNAYNFILSRK
jgi:hypothetical protein